METRYFFSVLSRRKWLLMLSVLTAALAAWFLVGLVPRVYKSSAQITTGIMSFKGVRVGEQNEFIQEFEIQSKFSNLIEYMKSRPGINRLSKLLVQHDLAPQPGEVPFRQLKKDVKITTQDINNYLAALELHSDPKPEKDSVLAGEADIKTLAKARELEKALGYDYETLKDKIDIQRVKESDYIKVEYKSDNPNQAYYVVSKFCSEFLNYYNNSRESATDKSVSFYNNLVKEKKDSLDRLTVGLNRYSKNNHIVGLPEQSQAIVSQIKELEMVRNDELKKKAAADAVNRNFAFEDSLHVRKRESTIIDDVTNNSELARVNDQINSVTAQYVDSGMKDKNMKDRLDNLKAHRQLVSLDLAKKRRKDGDPQNDLEKESYYKSLDARNNSSSLEKSVAVIEAKLEELKTQRDQLVKNNADVQKYSQDIDVAKKEYQYAVERQNLADVNKQSSERENPMRIIEPPFPPDKPENNNRPLIAAFAGVSAGSLATILLFLLIYFDSTISAPFQFKKQVGIPLIGIVNKIKSSALNNFNQLFTENSKAKDSERFKESLRKIRHEFEISGAKSFLFTSLKEREGKSFIVASLAYSLGLINKKVLIIDTNFKNNTLTGLSNQRMQENPITQEAKRMPGSSDLGFQIDLSRTDVIGNKGGASSPSERLAGIDFNKKMEGYKAEYDFIFLEAAAINKYSDASELTGYVDKVIAIFDAETNIKAADQDGIAFLKSLGSQLQGAILNKVDLSNLK